MHAVSVPKNPEPKSILDAVPVASFHTKNKFAVPCNFATPIEFKSVVGSTLVGAVVLYNADIPTNNLCAPLLVFILNFLIV